MQGDVPVDSMKRRVHVETGGAGRYCTSLLSDVNLSTSEGFVA